MKTPWMFDSNRCFRLPGGSQSSGRRGQPHPAGARRRRATEDSAVERAAAEAARPRSADATGRMPWAEGPWGA